MFQRLFTIHPKAFKDAQVGKISLLYLLFTFLLTFPLALQLHNSMFGYPSDNFTTTWYMWVLKQTGGLPLGELITNLVRHPLGENLGSFPWEVFALAPFLLLTYVFNEVVAFNLLTLLGFVSSALAMYLLIFYLIKDREIAFLAGLIYGFAPYHFWQGFVHFNLGLTYTLPVYVLALLNFDRWRDLKSSLLLAVIFGFTAFTSFYYGFFVLILSVGYFLGQIVVSLIRRKQYFSKAFFKSGLLTVAIMTLLLLPLWLLFNRQQGGTQRIPVRPLNDLLSLSARPWDLVLPAPNHPFWGQWASDLLKTIRGFSNDFKTVSAFLPERVLYVGITVLLTTLIGVGAILWKKRFRAWLLVLGVTLFVMVLFAAPPYIVVGGQMVKLPTFWLYPQLPMFRVYARLGILVLLVLVLLMSLGLKVLLEKKRGKNWILVIIGTLVFIEFLPFGWGQTTSLQTPAVYQWLKVQPDGVVVEYPVEYDNANGLIWQRYHGKRLYNAISHDEVIPLRTQLADLHNPGTWLKLKGLGVDYVVFHTKSLYEQPSPFEDRNAIIYDRPVTQDGPFSKVIARFDNAVVLQPVNNQSKMIIVDQLRETYQWLGEKNWTISQREANLYIYNQTEALKVAFEFEAQGEVFEKILVNGVQVSNLEFDLKKGMNEVIFIQKEARSLNLTNFQIRVR